MTPFMYFLLAALGIVLLVKFTLWYTDRAIREGRPGWAPPPKHEEGVYCPHAVGHKGDPGPAGKEDE